MQKSVKLDLGTITECLEHLERSLKRLTREEAIDVGARVHAIMKSSERIDKWVKEEVKIARRGKPGEVRGELFKAVLRVNPTTVLDQKALKEAEPDVYEKYARLDDRQVIIYEVK